MEAPRVQWGDRSRADANAGGVLGMLIFGVVTVIAAPVIIILLASNASDGVSTPAWALVAVVMVVIFGLGCAGVGLRLAMRRRQSYWLHLDREGLQLWSGRHSGPFSTIGWPNVEAAAVQPAPDGGEVLALRLRPRLDPGRIDDETRHMGRTALLNAGDVREWDLGFLLDSRNGRAADLAATVSHAASGTAPV